MFPCCRVSTAFTTGARRPRREDTKAFTTKDEGAKGHRRGKENEEEEGEEREEEEKEKNKTKQAGQRERRRSEEGVGEHIGEVAHGTGVLGLLRVLRAFVVRRLAYARMRWRMLRRRVASGRPSLLVSSLAETRQRSRAKRSR